MRVIAGRWRGRKLNSPQGQEIRPTTDRVKEALFSLLGPVLAEAVVLDLCCGAGGLGLEALSRGARQVILVDQARRSLALARANLELCGADPRTYRLIPAAAERWLTRWDPVTAGGPFLVLADPPYQSSATPLILARMVELSREETFAGAILEHGADFRPQPWADPDLDGETRTYGTSHLTVLRPSRRPETGRQGPHES